MSAKLFSVNLAEFVRSRREELNISQRELGKRSGLSHAYVGNIELGRNPATGRQFSPTIDALQGLAKGLNVPVFYLVSIALGLDTERAGKGLTAEEEAEYRQLKDEVMADPEARKQFQQFMQFLEWKKGQE